MNGDRIPSRTRAVFLDRDGTIIVDKSYLQDPRDIEILPGVPERLRMLQKRGYLLIVVTNQSGIGRGFFTPDDLFRQHEYLQDLLQSEGVTLSAIEFCPHHPNANCDCRKPRPGMLIRAAHRLDIDLSESYMVGDKISDVEAGAAAGCRTILVNPDPVWCPQADFQADSPAAALDMILKKRDQGERV